jgi:hypothetical protein
MKLTSTIMESMPQRRLLPFAVLVVWIAGLSPVRGQGPPLMNPAPAFDPHDISGYWELSPFDRSVPPADLTEVGRAKMAEARDADLISKRYCRALGVPAMMDPGRPLSITQGRYEVLVTAPVNTTHRHLLFRAQHTNPDIYDPSSVGESIAHWEGDTLVADTVGFHEKNGWLLIPGGGYRTPESHLVERYKLLKNGQVLSVTSTWTDPKVFAAPHAYEFWYHKINGPFEERPGIGCNAWDPERSAFVERGFSPEVKKKSDAALVAPGTARKY